MKTENINIIDTPYDKWIQWDITRECNFNCEYCFYPRSNITTKKNNPDFQAVLNFLKNEKFIYRIGFTGGEPFLVPEFIDFAGDITKAGHYISVNSNLSTNNITEFIEKADHDKIIFIHGSFHFKELEKRELTERFFRNAELFIQAGINLKCEAVSYPGYEYLCDKVMKLFNKRGIVINFAPYIGFYEGKWFPDSYTDEEKNIFELNGYDIDMYEQKGEICNAGYSAAVADTDGDIRKCFNSGVKTGNLYKEVTWGNEPEICQMKKCGCPLNTLDKGLYEKFWR